MVVVGIDFSPGSARALETARSLATTVGTDVYTIHVVTPSESEWRTREGTDRWLEDRGLSASDVHQRWGEPWLELLKAAEEMDATLIVAGCHGRSGFQPLRLGSTASHMALSSRTPVVLVPERAPFTSTTQKEKP